MSTSKAIREKRAPVAKQMKELSDKLASENRDFTADEQKRWAELDTEYRSLTARLEIVDRAAVIDDEQQRATDRAPGQGDYDGKKSQEKRDERQEEFKTPREFLLAVMNAGQGRSLDKRLEKRAVGSDEAKIVSDPAGGFLVPEQFVPKLLQVDPEMDPMGGMTQRIPMSSQIVKIPARVDKNHSTSVSGGFTVSRRPETVAFASSQMTLEQVTLEAHTLVGLTYATEELLQYSPISFAALIQAGFSDQFTSHLINERLNGTGIGEYLGVMNAPCLISVAKETGQAAATINYTNVLKMRSRCWGYSKAVWIANHDTMVQLMSLNQVVGIGGAPVWQPSAREDHPDLLLGRPIIFTEYAKTLGTSGDLVLGNWSEYLEGTLQPLQNAESIHVRFVNHERTFKFWMSNAGAPWWKSALTPKNSSNTLSPFVVCDTRA